jgi:hypothetical protein
MNAGKSTNKGVESGEAKTELILQSLIESFKIENIYISEERARAILKKVELRRGK